MPANATARVLNTSSPLIGRAAELGRLMALLESVADGGGTTVLLGGEAGVGKSRLCRELKREAAARQMRVIEGRCTSTRASVAYGPFLDAIRFRLARGEQQEAAGTLAPILGYLTPLFPELGPSDAPASEVPVSQDRAFEVISSVFARLASLGPLLLLLEDLHWADSSSLELVSFLAERVRKVPLLLLGTYRSDELTARHRMRPLLVRLNQERLGHHLTLRPLNREEVAELARLVSGRDLPEPELTSLWERSQGNPFYVEELLAAAEVVPGSFRGSAPPPSTIRDAVRARAEQLSPNAADVLAIAAVIGRRFSYELLQAVSELPDDELFVCVAELLDHQLLVEDEGPDEEHYCFRHVLTQQALYADLVAPKRRLWHSKIAAALEARPAQAQPAYLEEIAHHYRRSGNVERARQFDVLAGEGAARIFAWSAAESHYLRALAASDKGPPDPHVLASVLDRLAEVVWWQGRPEEALDYASRAVAIQLRPPDPSAVAARLRRLALLSSRYSDHRGRVAGYLKAALAVLGTGPERSEHARITNDMGRFLALERPAEAETWLKRGLGLAQRLGEPAEIAFALAELGRLSVARAHVGPGLRRFQQARLLLREEEFPVERAVAIYLAGVPAYAAAADRDTAREWLSAAAAYASAHGLTTDLALCRCYEGLLAVDVCWTEDVLERTRSAVTVLRQIRGPDLGDALDLLGELHLGRGNLDAAAACYGEALALGTRQAILGRTRVLLASQRWDEACGELEEAIARWGGTHQLLTLRGLPILVEGHIRAGRVGAAAEALARLEAETAASDDRVSQTAARQAAARVHAARGDRAAARPALEAAAAGWRSLGRTLEGARAELELGALLLVDPADGEWAATKIRMAVALLDRIGAAPYARQGRALLVRQGYRAPPRPRPGAASPVDRLTRREMEVLRQLTRGSTNKEIARALDISERTAAVHVSHLLAKLRCTTRTQAVSQAIAQGLVQPSY